MALIDYIIVTVFIRFLYLRLTLIAGLLLESIPMTATQIDSYYCDSIATRIALIKIDSFCDDSE